MGPAKEKRRSAQTHSRLLPPPPASVMPLSTELQGAHNAGEFSDVH